MSYQNVNAYAAHQQVQMDGREIDKRALLTCANRLQEALDDGGKNFRMYQDAVRYNQQLWTLFQVAVSDPTNPLNPNLKTGILNLSGYVDRVSFRCITEFLPDRLKSLISINRTVAAGLAKKPQQPAAQPQAQAPVQATPVDQPMAFNASV